MVRLHMTSRSVQWCSSAESEKEKIKKKTAIKRKRRGGMTLPTEFGAIISTYMCSTRAKMPSRTLSLWLQLLVALEWCPDWFPWIRRVHRTLWRWCPLLIRVVRSIARAPFHAKFDFSRNYCHIAASSFFQNVFHYSSETGSLLCHLTTMEYI